MILARLRVEESAAGRHLIGRTVSSWDLPVGSMVLLKRDGDEYVLIELGDRKCRTPDDTTLASFIDEEG
jgi:hypothetical protein